MRQPSRGHVEERIRIAEWDWRYRVGFDAALASRIGESIRLVPDAERRIQEGILGWATGFVSLAALLDALDRNDSVARKALTDGVDESSLLHVPSCLAPSLEKKLGRLSESLTRRERRLLERLLERAADVIWTDRHSALFDLIFAAQGDELVAAGRRRQGDPRLPDDTDRLAPSEVEDFVSDFLSRLSGDPMLEARFGECALPSFEIEVRAGDGYAEYWPVELVAGAKRDRLVLMDNDESLRPGNVEVSLVHELFPGHALLFERARSQSFVDYGAAAFIEGWATWCEWAVLDTAYSRFARASRAALLRFYDGSGAGDSEAMLAHFLKAGHSRESALRMVGQYFQYPGLTFSYTLGALWFEEALRERTPKAFLDGIQGRPWGDFFSLWSA